MLIILTVVEAQLFEVVFVIVFLVFFAVQTLNLLRRTQSASLCCESILF